jgi:hypothetical protein
LTKMFQCFIWEQSKLRFWISKMRCPILITYLWSWWTWFVRWICFPSKEKDFCILWNCAKNDRENEDVRYFNCIRLFFWKSKISVYRIFSFFLNQNAHWQWNYIVSQNPENKKKEEMYHLVQNQERNF